MMQDYNALPQTIILIRGLLSKKQMHQNCMLSDILIMYFAIEKRRVFGLLFFGRPNDNLTT